MPKPEPVDRLYEDHPIYWSDLLRHSQPEAIVKEYLLILQSMRNMAGQPLNDFVEIPDAKKYGPGPDADQRTWSNYWTDHPMAPMWKTLTTRDASKEDGSLIKSVQDVKVPEDSKIRATEVVETEEDSFHP
ncbi:hypothetical protein N0V91_003368 [Didymella pomorum]|uniref:Uncharacterized protein n=1 Tax=Didymella pomorum TaxID=749634 RepID=A0A9W8ZGT2_9PLEO|nr:hypothetical protein N0V91_003368 [Didymella pomorum]